VITMLLNNGAVFSEGGLTPEERQAAGLDKLPQDFVDGLRRASIYLHHGLERESAGSAPRSPRQTAAALTVDLLAEVQRQPEEQSESSSKHHREDGVGSEREGRGGGEDDEDGVVGTQMATLWDYHEQGFEMSTGDRDVSLAQGDLVVILERLPNDWVRVESGDKIGVVPFAYLGPSDA
jgi:SH3 domain